MRVERTRSASRCCRMSLIPAMIPPPASGLAGRRNGQRCQFVAHPARQKSEQIDHPGAASQQLRQAALSRSGPARSTEHWRRGRPAVRRSQDSLVCANRPAHAQHVHRPGTQIRTESVPHVPAFCITHRPSPPSSQITESPSALRVFAAAHYGPRLRPDQAGLKSPRSGRQPRLRERLQTHSAVIDVTLVFSLYRSVILLISQRSIFSQSRSSSSP